MFDRKVIPALCPNSAWNHEMASINLLRCIEERPEVSEGFKKWGFCKEDIEFVKSLIIGKPESVSNLFC